LLGLGLGLALLVQVQSRWANLMRTVFLLPVSLGLAAASLLAFDQFFILTKGAPDNTTVTVVQVIYREAFQRQNLGTAAALSIIVLAVLLALNALQFRFLRGSAGNRA
jgi:ABC-type sugar transport system permease subunit